MPMPSSLAGHRWRIDDLSEFEVLNRILDFQFAQGVGPEPTGNELVIHFEVRAQGVWPGCTLTTDWDEF
jgi:hypothetical protein